MVRRIHSKFLLEVFDSKLSNLKGLSRYLNIYLQNISPENRTDTNELIAFLEQPLEDQRVIYFGLLYDGVPCGFASFIYYPSHSTAIVDHVAIDTRVRGIGAFFALVDLISDYLTDVGIIPDYVVAEIMRRSQSLQGEVNPAQLIRLLRTIGFRVIQIPYFAPHAGITQQADRYKSALMVIPSQPVNEISADECKRLIELIYYQHYLKWYERVWKRPQTTAYRRALDKCFEVVSKRLSATPFVKLNGAPVTSEDIVVGAGVATHARDYTYAALFLGPVVLTLAISLAQALWLTATAMGATLVGLLVIFAVPRWRQKLMQFFRPE